MAEKLPPGGFADPPQVRQEPGYVILQRELVLYEEHQHGRCELFAHLAAQADPEPDPLFIAQ